MASYPLNLQPYCCTACHQNLQASIQPDFITPRSPQIQLCLQRHSLQQRYVDTDFKTGSYLHVHQSYEALNWHHRSALESHCATLRRTHRIPRIWITTTTNPTTASATQQLVLTAARHTSSLLPLQLAFSSQHQSAPAALYIDILCTSKHLQQTN